MPESSAGAPTEAARIRLPMLSKENRADREDRARTWIAYVFVGGYILVLICSLVPVWVFLSQHSPLSMNDLKDVAGVIAAAVSSLTGLLGFVLGYYFKAAEDKRI